jgi:hypothetical protein
MAQDKINLVLICNVGFLKKISGRFPFTSNPYARLTKDLLRLSIYLRANRAVEAEPRRKTPPQICLQRPRHLERQSLLKITKVVQSDREYTLHLDGSISGQWIELLREAAASVLAEELGLTVDLNNRL